VDFKFQARFALQSTSATPNASAFKKCSIQKGAADSTELVRLHRVQWKM